MGKVEDEASFDYSDSNEGTTHILITHFPEATDEPDFLLALANYVRSRTRQLKNKEQGIQNH